MLSIPRLYRWLLRQVFVSRRSYSNGQRLAHIRETEHRFSVLVQRNSQLPKLTVTENLYFHTVIEKFINIPFWNYCFLFSRCKVKARKWGESCTTTVLQPKKIGTTAQSMETVAPKKVHLPLQGNYLFAVENILYLFLHHVKNLRLLLVVGTLAHGCWWVRYIGSLFRVDELQAFSHHISPTVSIPCL